MSKEGVVQSGSMSVHDDGSDDKGNPTDAGTHDDGKGGEKSFAGGKFKSAEDMEKSYLELEKKVSEQGAQNNQLLNQMALLQNQQTPPDGGDGSDAGPSEAQAALADAMGRFDKIDFVGNDDAPQEAAALMKEMIGLTAQATKEEVLGAATAEFGKVLTERDNAATRDNFLQQNPDFAELQASGAFQALKSENPMHDDFSAYYAHRAGQASERIAALEAELAEAKRIANLAEGDAGTSSVFTTSGQARGRGQRPAPKTRQERHASALDAVRASRKAG